MSCQDELKNSWIEKNLIFYSKNCLADFFPFSIISLSLSLWWLSVSISVLMLTAASHLAELHWMDSPDGPHLMAARVSSCRTVRGGSPSSTSLAVSMTWPARAPCPAPPPSPQSSVTRRTSSWRPSLRSWPAWGQSGVTTFTWPTFPAGQSSIWYYYHFFLIITSNRNRNERTPSRESDKNRESNSSLHKSSISGGLKHKYMKPCVEWRPGDHWSWCSINLKEKKMNYLKAKVKYHFWSFVSFPLKFRLQFCVETCPPT